jgi:hypothetical protein
VTWDRESLLGAFTADEEADTACLSALAAGAVYREPPDDLVETANLVTIYDRRAQHLADRGVATVGFERAVERLRLVGGSVRIGSVHTDDFNFLFFVDATEPVVVACCGGAASRLPIPSGTGRSLTSHSHGLPRAAIRSWHPFAHDRFCRCADALRTEARRTGASVRAVFSGGQVAAVHAAFALAGYGGELRTPPVVSEDERLFVLAQDDVLGLPGSEAEQRPFGAKDSCRRCADQRCRHRI